MILLSIFTWKYSINCLLSSFWILQVSYQKLREHFLLLPSTVNSGSSPYMTTI